MVQVRRPNHKRMSQGRLESLVPPPPQAPTPHLAEAAAHQARIKRQRVTLAVLSHFSQPVPLAKRMTDYKHLSKQTLRN